MNQLLNNIVHRVDDIGIRTPEEVAALAELMGLDPNTLSWMTVPPPEAPAPPLSRFKYDPLSDAEWEVIAPHWPSANQASTAPRAIVNALLMKASTGCGWGHVAEIASPEAARQQYRRRKKSGQLATLAQLLRGRLTERRLSQIERLRGPRMSDRSPRP